MQVNAFIQGIRSVVTFNVSAPPECHPAFVLAPPKPELCTVLMAVASVVEADPTRYKPATFGQSVSYVTGRTLHDSVLNKSNTQGRISLHAQFDVGKMPQMVARPDALGPRTDSKIPEPILDGLEGTSTIEPAKKYFRHCVRPVVVFTTRPNELADYFEAARSVIHHWGALEERIRFSTSTQLEDWFRRPVLIVSPEQARGREWLRQLDPAVVICLGWRSWSKPARWNWPAAKHVLVLDVQSSDDIESFRAFHDGTDGLIAVPNFDRGEPNQPEVCAFLEMTKTMSADSDWEEDIDLG